MNMARPFEIVETVVRVNDERKTLMADRVIEACGGSVAGKTIAVLGWPSSRTRTTCAMRRRCRSSEALQQFGARLRAYDPEAMTQAADIAALASIYADDPYACAADADAVCDRDGVGCVPRARSSPVSRQSCARLWWSTLRNSTARR